MNASLLIACPRASKELAPGSAHPIDLGANDRPLSPWAYHTGPSPIRDKPFVSCRTAMPLPRGMITFLQEAYAPVPGEGHRLKGLRFLLKVQAGE